MQPFTPPPGYGQQVAPAPQYPQAPPTPQYPPQGAPPPFTPPVYQQPVHAPPQAYGQPAMSPAPQVGGMFAGLNGTQVYGRGVYFDAPTENGVFVCSIDQIIVKILQQAQQPGLIVEMSVLESSNPQICAIGSKRSWVQSLKDRRVAFASILEFLAALTGYDRNNPEHQKVINSTITAQSEAMIEEAQKGTIWGHSLRDARIKCLPRHYKTKAGKEMTVVNFAPAT